MVLAMLLAFVITIHCLPYELKAIDFKELKSMVLTLQRFFITMIARMTSMSLLVVVNSMNTLIMK